MPIAVSKPVAYLLFLGPIVLFIFFILSLNPWLWGYEWEIQGHFNNWEDDPYVEGIHDCSHMSIETERYWETVKNFDCYLIYGNSSNNQIVHMWNLVKIDGSFYEFECVHLCFRKVSEQYNVYSVTSGFYIDGVKQDDEMEMNNWRNIFKELK